MITTFSPTSIAVIKLTTVTQLLLPLFLRPYCCHHPLLAIAPIPPYSHHKIVGRGGRLELVEAPQLHHIHHATNT